MGTHRFLPPLLFPKIYNTALPSSRSKVKLRALTVLLIFKLPETLHPISLGISICSLQVLGSHEDEVDKMLAAAVV